jgi:hypothetical protein
MQVADPSRQHACANEPATDGSGTNVAGIADAAGHQPEGMPSHAEIDFRSDDIERSVAHATEDAGGTRPPP